MTVIHVDDYVYKSKKMSTSAAGYFPCHAVWLLDHFPRQVSTWDFSISKCSSSGNFKYAIRNCHTFLFILCHGLKPPGATFLTKPQQTDLTLTCRTVHTGFDFCSSQLHSFLLTPFFFMFRFSQCLLTSLCTYHIDFCFFKMKCSLSGYVPY